MNYFFNILVGEGQVKWEARTLLRGDRFWIFFFFDFSFSTPLSSLHELPLFSSLNLLSPLSWRSKFSSYLRIQRDIDTLEDWFARIQHTNLVSSPLSPIFDHVLNWSCSFWIDDWKFDWLHINQLMYVIQLLKEYELDF